MTTFSTGQAPPLSVVTPDPSVLAANLSALSRRNPRLAEAICAAATPPGLRFHQTEQGALSAELDERALASKRRPLEEAQRLADTLDPAASGCAVVLGFGLGHHVRLLAEKMESVGVVACFEPDLGLLRGVLECIDHSAWLAAGTTAIFHDADDQAAITFAVQGWEAPLAVGVQIIEHAPSRARLGDLGGRFARSISAVVGTVRTHVVTTMVQSDVTARNALMNIADYAGRPGIGELQALALGRPAIVVAAGPSLKRNIALLKDTGIRERCVVIAVQTVLKQLLAEGIRPHFVCALDYHEVSKRFYEGLTADDVRGITLVAEPKANGAILDAFPGDKRLVADDFLDELIFTGAPEPLAEAHAPMKPGATVAHLAYYLARFLGSDPVILVGQDLAFTDGQYYSAGAAIHNTWACELNAFNTLEMMEWQRIIRMRGNLHAVTDHLGRPVYSDDQMVAYLHQFERDFREDDARGLTIIDATEGGVRKNHTIPMPLAEAIELHIRHARPLAPFPAANSAPTTAPGTDRLKPRLQQVRQDVRTVARLSRETRDLLGKLAGSLDDNQRANALIRQVHALRDRVEALRPAYPLVHRINQTGTFKRFKADRAIQLETTLTEHQKQRRRVERDSMNVGWLADSADALDDLLSAAIGTLEGRPKRTRDITPNPEGIDKADADARPHSKCATAALILLDSQDPYARTDIAGTPAIRATLERLAKASTVRRVALITDNEPAARALVAGPILGLDISFLPADLSPWRQRLASIRTARAWAGTCWRAGIAGMTVFDEAFDPALAARAMERENLDGALVLGASWCHLDPDLTRAIVERFEENPAHHPLTFTQAPPGLCGCVISRAMVSELVKGIESASPLASIAGVLGYRPLNARADPIALPGCVTIAPHVRDTLARFIPDHARWTAISAALLAAGPDADTDRLCNIARSAMIEAARQGPSELVIRLSNSARFASRDSIERILRDSLDGRAAPALTLVGSEAPGRDALDHPDFEHLLRAAAQGHNARHFPAVHVRSTLRIDPAAAERLIPVLSQLADVISIDCFANAPDTYRELTGQDLYDTVLSNADLLIRARRIQGGLLAPWIVPRITRRDAVYAQIEQFFDKSLLIAGWGVIDPLPEPIPGERITPLPPPSAGELRTALSLLTIDATGNTPAGFHPAWTEALRTAESTINSKPRLRDILNPRG